MSASSTAIPRIKDMIVRGPGPSVGDDPGEESIAMPTTYLRNAAFLKRLRYPDRERNVSYGRCGG
jgi:hypothetical protein